MNLIINNMEEIDFYRHMAESFNKLSFKEKILFIKRNNTYIQLCADGNWWGVLIKDKKVQEDVEELDEFQFEIENEFFHNEFFCLFHLLGVEIGEL